MTGRNGDAFVAIGRWFAVRLVGGVFVGAWLAELCGELVQGTLTDCPVLRCGSWVGRYRHRFGDRWLARSLVRWLGGWLCDSKLDRLLDFSPVIEFTGLFVVWGSWSELWLEFVGWAHFAPFGCFLCCRSPRVLTRAT